MEGDEMEMSKEELRKWIRKKVKKNKLISLDVLEKCRLLQSLLERREQQAALLLKLCKSVSECEAIVNKQFSFLEWETRDTDSVDDDDDNITVSENTVSKSPTTNGLTPLLPVLQDSENSHRDGGKKPSISLKRKAVVVLTRLPISKIRSLCPPKPQNNESEDDCFSMSDSDMQWEPDVVSSGDSSDSDYSISSKKSGSDKRRKTDQNNSNNQKLSKSHAAPQASTNSDAKSNTTKTSTPQASSNSDAEINAAKTSTPQASTNAFKSNAAQTSTLNASASSDVKSNTTKTSTPQENNKGDRPVCITALCQADKATKPSPSVPLGELKVNMSVLARRGAMKWDEGKITEIVKKEDGRVKYKIQFKEKGRSRLSGNHIAFDYMPKVDQLFVGARVVVKIKASDECRFCPGVMAELPSRKNRMRFLVFMDDHTPIYVGLPLLHLVCRPLTDPLEDVPEGDHRTFLEQYLKAWPYPPQSQYRVGQAVSAELNGIRERCEVLVVDCSLIQVLVAADQRKEWIYRGSMCLEHMSHLRGLMELKQKEEQKKKPTTVNESSKSAH